MKKKLLILTLCFTLLFSSLSYKKSYAYGGIISVPMLATISALAVGSNIIINNIDDLYDLGRMFYDYVDRDNDLTWSVVQTVFASSVALHSNKLVSVKSDFLDIVKDFFDSTFNGSYSSTSSFQGVPVYPSSLSSDQKFLDHVVNGGGIPFVFEPSSFYVGDIFLDYVTTNSNGSYTYFINGNSASSVNLYPGYSNHRVVSLYNGINYTLAFVCYSSKHGRNVLQTEALLTTGSLSFDFPYSGGYTWDNVDSKKENESISLPIPGDLGSLVGQNSDSFWDNTDNLVGQGGLVLPGVDNPSIGVDSSVNTFPGVDVDVPGVGSPSVPNEGIWATIKDFIIGLVVPSDTYWTDTWGGLYNNFTNSFPMVDMDNFNKLVTGEKKFPNIDVDIMGVSGRVVNGDVINSIVDWLRPIVAGFMMLCLMLFNYRKIYKLIRNSEPFGSVASGNNSDIRTGISEYSKHEVIKATDMVAEYHAWKERGGK